MKPDNESNSELPPSFETMCAHYGEDPAQHHGAVIPPIYQNSLFTFPDCATRELAYDGVDEELYSYTRLTNPTTDIVEAKIAALEGGEKARCFASGMAAVTAAILSCVKAGDHVICPQTVYGPTHSFLAGYLKKFNITCTFVDGCRIQDFEQALRPETSLIFLETPSSSIFKQQDMEAVSSLAKQNKISTICDNSWASPYFQRPLQFGIDLVVHSATKYLGGHSDIMAGVVIGDAKRMRRLTFQEGCLIGGILDPFASWLLLRGLRTLPIRMDRHQTNGMRIATALSDHPKVAKVFFPGLPDDPQADLTAKQLRGTSSLLSIQLKSSSKESTYKFIDSLKYFGIGCSWGGFESLAQPVLVPAQHIDISQNDPVWITRLHIGLENADDLWNDLQQALDKV